jgi:hypothetical protein
MGNPARTQLSHAPRAPLTIRKASFVLYGRSLGIFPQALCSRATGEVFTSMSVHADYHNWEFDIEGGIRIVWIQALDLDHGHKAGLGF